MKCDLEAIEAMVLGELAPERAAEVSAHVESCADCGRERELLRAERALLARRAEAEPAVPPQIWREVQRRIETPRRSAWRWGAVVALAASASAAALALAWLRPPPPRPQPVVVAPAPPRAPAPRPGPDGVLDAAEEEYRQAIAVLEKEFAQARGRLAPPLAHRWEKTFASARVDVAQLSGARVADPDARVRSLDGYAAYLRSLQTAVLALEEGRR
jgi:hypothetical protein